MNDNILSKEDIIKEYRKAVAIRILPHDKNTFADVNKLLSFLKGTLVKRGGKYYFPKKSMNCPAHTLVFFQYDGKISASAILLSRTIEKCVDEVGNIYEGFYMFDPNTLILYIYPITVKEYHTVDQSVDRFSRAMRETDILLKDKVIELIESKV